MHASAESVAADDPGRFHALFGRDSLITALQVLPEQPEVAAATLRALAARQGVRIGCFRPPSTPDGVSRLRLTAHVQLTDAELDDACAVLAGLIG